VDLAKIYHNILYCIYTILYRVTLCWNNDFTVAESPPPQSVIIVNWYITICTQCIISCSKRTDYPPWPEHVYLNTLAHAYIVVVYKHNLVYMYKCIMCGVCVLLSISSKHLVCRRRHRTRIKHNYYSFDSLPLPVTTNIIRMCIIYISRGRRISCPTIEICPWLRSELGPSNDYHTNLYNIY